MADPDPIVRPQLEIGGKLYTLKYPLSAVIALERNGLTLRDLAPDTFTIEKLLRFVIAGISHEAALDLDTVSEQLDLNDIPRIAEAVRMALAKVRPPAQVSLREPAALPN